MVLQLIHRIPANFFAELVLTMDMEFASKRVENLVALLPLHHPLSNALDHLFVDSESEVVIGLAIVSQMYSDDFEESLSAIADQRRSTFARVCGYAIVDKVIVHIEHVGLAAEQSKLILFLVLFVE